MPIYDLTLRNASNTSPLLEVVGPGLLSQFSLPLINWERSGTKLLVVPTIKGRKLKPDQGRDRLLYQSIPNFKALLVDFVQAVITTTRQLGLTYYFSSLSDVSLVTELNGQAVRHYFVLSNFQDNLKVGPYQKAHIEAAIDFLDSYQAEFQPDFDLSYQAAQSAEQERQANNVVIDGVLAQVVAQLQDQPSDRDLALLGSYLASFHEFIEDVVLPTDPAECDRLMALIPRLPWPYWVE